jgi:hypothetical protein
MNRRPVLVLRQLPALLLLASCQGSPASQQSERAPNAVAVPAAIEVRDRAGTVLASVSPALPCRARVDGSSELVVAGRPVDITLGNIHWTADDDNGGTLVKRDGEVVARIAPATGSSDELGGFRAVGVASGRAMLADGAARVIDGQRVVLRTATRTPSGITAGDRTVTGTDDVLLAAILSAPEVAPEVRALAACLRAAPGDKAL